MRIATASILLILAASRPGLGQVGGNAGYGQPGGRAQAVQEERAKRQVTRDDAPPSDTTLFVDANVLLNVKADQFVATFGVAEEAATVEACQAKMDATVAAFLDAIKPLGVDRDAIFVDFAAQSKVYGFKVEGNLAREELAGFELKKTIAVRYRDKALIDRLVVAASRAKVHDLIKVDYVVTDLAPVHERLAEEAAAVVKAKAARNERLLGIKLRPVPQIYAERTSAHFPTRLYDSYVAGETEGMSVGQDRSRVTAVQSLRKSRTFFFNPLDADGFDRVVEPVILEPVVQFTHYLKLKYEIEARR